MPMAKPQKFTFEQINKSLVKHRGTIALTADHLGCSTQTLYNYLKRFPGLQDTINHFRERRVDKAEIALERAIERGEAWAIALTLKTLGRSRGYVEKQEISYTEEKPINQRFFDELAKTRSDGNSIPSRSDQSCVDGAAVGENVHGGDIYSGSSN